ncbi:MAG: putative Ig domain-containing protein [Myxococcota bacterium]
MILTETRGIAGDMDNPLRFIVQYDNVLIHNQITGQGDPSTATFQIVLFAESHNIEIRHAGTDMSSSSVPFLIGMEDAEGNRGLTLLRGAVGDVTRSWRVVSPNQEDPPRIVTTPELLAVVGQNYTTTMEAQEYAELGIIDWTLDDSPPGMTLSDAGPQAVLSWTPGAVPPGDGLVPVAVTVTDGNGRSSTQSWNILVENRGPDLFGYTWAPTPGFVFNDISLDPAATPFVLTDESKAGPVNIGFRFNYFGTYHEQLFIDDNGYLTFASGPSDNTADPIPSVAPPNGYIAGLWTDLFTQGGQVHTKVVGTEGTRQFIVQYTNVPHYTGSGPDLNLTTFQIVLYEGTNDFTIYHHTTDTNSALHTIGFEHPDALTGFGLTMRHGNPNAWPVGLSGSAWRVDAPNVAPLANHKGPYLVEEGKSVTLSAECLAGSCDSFAWDIGNDGTIDPSDPTGITAEFPAYTLDGPVDVPVRLEVCNTDGLCNASVTTVTVENVPPRIVTSPITGVGDQIPYTYRAQALEPAGTTRDPLTWSLSDAPDTMSIDSNTGVISWLEPQLSTPLNLVTVVVQDDDGGVDIQSYTLTVYDTISDYGYTWSPVAYTFNDISIGANTVTTASGLRALGDDEMSDPILLPFEFNWYGVNYTEIFVCSNGYIVIGSDVPNACLTAAQDTPNGAATPNQMVAGYWEDLNPAAGGSVQYLIEGSVGQRTLTIQFTEVRHALFNGSRATFQIVLFEQDDTVEVRHLRTQIDDLDEDLLGIPVNPAVIGFENGDGSDGLLIRRLEDELLDPALERVALTERAWRISPPDLTPTISMVNPPYTVFEGGTLPINANCDAGQCVEWQWDLDCDVLPFNEISATSQNVIFDATTLDGPLDCTIHARACSSQGSCSFTLSELVTVRNATPFFTSSPTAVATVGEEYTYPIEVEDAGQVDVLDLRLDSSAGPIPVGMYIDASGVLHWTPICEQVGNQTVTVVADDGDGGVATQSWTVSVQGTDSDSDGVNDCLDNCPAVANTSIRAISVDGLLDDFGGSLGTDNRIGSDVTFYYSADSNFLHVGLAGLPVELGGDSLHVAIRVPSDMPAMLPADQTHEGVRFGSGKQWTYMVSLRGSGDVCFYDLNAPDPTLCQQVGRDIAQPWAHHTGFAGAPRNELSIPRAVLGSLAMGTGSFELGLFVSSNDGSVVKSAWPNTNPVGGRFQTWSTWLDAIYPTFILGDDFDNDGLGDACDDDIDNDNLANAVDSCLYQQDWTSPTAFTLADTRTGDFEGAAAVASSDALYLFGGLGGSTQALRFDVSTATFTDIGPLPVAVSQAQATIASDGIIHIFGGTNAAGTGTVDTHLVYDPDLNSYTPSTPVPPALQRAWRGGSMASADGYAYFVGGVDPQTGLVETRVGRFDLFAGGFEVLSPASPAPAFGAGADRSQSALGPDGVIYFTNATGVLHRFDTGAQDWLAPQPLPNLNLEGPLLATLPETPLMFVMGDDGGSGSPSSLQGYSVQAQSMFTTPIAWPTSNLPDGLQVISDGTEATLVAWVFGGVNSAFYSSTLPVNQRDLDLDGLGNGCDDDRDGDNVINTVDNCPDVSNAAQVDSDGVPPGDACDPILLSPTLVDVTPDMTRYSNTPVTVTFSLEDGCTFAPEVLSPTDAVRVSQQRSGAGGVTRFEKLATIEGLYNVFVEVESRCFPGLIASRNVRVAIDTTNPLILFGLPELALTVPNEGPEFAYPTIIQGGLLSFSPEFFDPTSGLTNVRVTLDDTHELTSATFPEMLNGAGVFQGNTSPVTLTCDDASYCTMGGRLDTSTMSLGAHCIDVSAEDSAGNAVVESYCFKVIDGENLNELVPAVCAAVNAVTTPYIVAGGFTATEAQIADDLCTATLPCAAALSTDNALMGCVVKGLGGTQKSLANLSVDIFDDGIPENDGDIAVIATLQQQLASLLSDLVTVYRDTFFAASPDSLVLGDSFISEAYTASTAGGQVNKATEAFFWYDDARRPFPKIDNGASCPDFADLTQEMEAFALLNPPGSAALASLLVEMGEVNDLLCTVTDPNADCYDVSAVLALGALSDLARSMSLLDQDRASEDYLLWVDNWRFALARVAQRRITLALMNVEGWVRFGGMHPDFEQSTLDAANMRWLDVEYILDDERDLDRFMGEFISTSAKCDILLLFEAVNDWWVDASNPACGDLVPLVLPPACLNDMGLNLWPLRGTNTTTVVP